MEKEKIERSKIVYVVAMQYPDCFNTEIFETEALAEKYCKNKMKGICQDLIDSNESFQFSRGGNEFYLDADNKGKGIVFSYYSSDIKNKDSYSADTEQELEDNKNHQ